MQFSHISAISFKKVSAFTLSLLCVGLTGCASIVDGTHQSVLVQSQPVTGASCVLENDKGKWFVNNTPGSVMVHRSYHALAVQCRKHGYQITNTRVESKIKGMALGNVLFGGAIGVGVDAADGAAYDYPNTIVVPMKRDN